MDVTDALVIGGLAVAAGALAGWFIGWYFFTTRRWEPNEEWELPED